MDEMQDKEFRKVGNQHLSLLSKNTAKDIKSTITKLSSDEPNAEEYGEFKEIVEKNSFYVLNDARDKFAEVYQKENKCFDRDGEPLSMKLSPEKISQPEDVNIRSEMTSPVESDPDQIPKKKRACLYILGYVLLKYCVAIGLSVAVFILLYTFSPGDKTNIAIGYSVFAAAFIILLAAYQGCRFAKQKRCHSASVNQPSGSGKDNIPQGTGEITLSESNIQILLEENDRARHESTKNALIVPVSTNIE